MVQRMMLSLRTNGRFLAVFAHTANIWIAPFGISGGFLNYVYMCIYIYALQQFIEKLLRYLGTKEVRTEFLTTKWLTMKEKVAYK